MQEIVYLVKTGLDFEGAQKQVLESRFPYLEYPYPGLSTIKKTPSPKMIKTHLPLTLLPKSTLENGAKVLFLVFFLSPSLLIFIGCLGYIHFTKPKGCGSLILLFSKNGIICQLQRNI